MSPERVIVYIDGFNFYHGLRDAGLHTSRWLDFTALSRALLKPWQNLVEVRYFTTRIRNHRGTEARQGVYLDALGQDSMMSIDYGHFLEKNMTCKKCGGTWRKAEEKNRAGRHRWHSSRTSHPAHTRFAAAWDLLSPRPPKNRSGSTPTQFPSSRHARSWVVSVMPSSPQGWCRSHGTPGHQVGAAGRGRSSGTPTATTGP